MKQGRKSGSQRGRHVTGTGKTREDESLQSGRDPEQKKQAEQRIQGGNSQDLVTGSLGNERDSQVYLL